MKRRMFQAMVVAVAAAIGLAGLVGAAASDKPRIAVLEFKNKAQNQWWWNGGAEAAQDVFVTELVKSGKFRVIDREQLAALMQEKNLALDGDIDPATAIKAGQLLGCQYFLTGAVTEYGAGGTEAHGSGVDAASQPGRGQPWLLSLEMPRVEWTGYPRRLKALATFLRG
jgi:curli biogenesis system outer membrane secretion channel CsgG